MTEQLLKLKKDGKTVGYLKITDKIWWKINRSWIEIDPQEGCSEFFEDDNGWDTAHPFVTKDRHCKDIFEGDRATAIVWMEDLANHRIEGEIIYYNCGYCIQTTSTYYHLNDLKDIELIEEKSNDNS